MKNNHFKFYQDYKNLKLIGYIIVNSMINLKYSRYDPKIDKTSIENYFKEILTKAFSKKQLNLEVINTWSFYSFIGGGNLLIKKRTYDSKCSLIKFYDIYLKSINYFLKNQYLNR